MAPPRNTSTIPDNVPMILPPLEPAQKKGVTPPVVYTLRLSDEVVKALMSADKPTIKFSSDTKGVLSVPQLRDIPFTARPIADANSETARAVCYSRRGAKLRTVGPIVADLQLEQRLSSQISDMTKKRSIDATMAKSGREVKKLEMLPSDLPASKRARVAKPSKRPRPNSVSQPPSGSAMRRPALTSQPVPLMPLSKPAPPQSQPPPPAHNLHAHNHARSPSAPPHALPLRSAPPSAAHSPASPAHPSRASRPPSRSGPTPPGIAKRSTPTRPALGAMPRKPSPASALPAASLPRPGARRPSLPSSRGPSPRAAGGASPRSPRLAGSATGGLLRSRPRDRASDVRRTVVHALALRDCTLSDLKGRLRADDGSETHDTLVRVVQEVAEKRSGSLRLKADAWADVSDDYEGYSDAERARVRGARAEATRGGGSGSGSGSGSGGGSGGGGATRGLVEPNMGGANAAGHANGNGNAAASNHQHAVKVRDIGTHGMSDAALDNRLESYERDERVLRIGKVSTDDQESDLRRRFDKWYPVYQALVGRLDDLRKLFVALEKSLTGAHGPRERDAVVREIHATHERYGVRHKRYVRMLPVLHARLKDMHRALGDGLAH